MVPALPAPEEAYRLDRVGDCPQVREAVFPRGPVEVCQQVREEAYQPDPAEASPLAPEAVYQLDREEASRQGRAVDFQTRQTLGEATEKAAGIEHATTDTCWLYGP